MTLSVALPWFACGLAAALIRYKTLKSRLTIGELALSIYLVALGGLGLFVILAIELMVFFACNANRPVFGAPKNPTQAERDSWVADAE